jgi:hypothetical protein
VSLCQAPPGFGHFPVSRRVRRRGGKE